MEVYISNISYTNVTGYKLFMNGVRKEVLYDLDGSFTTTDFDGIQRVSAAITNNWSHLRSEIACKATTNTGQWHNTLACDDTVKVALVRFTGLTPSSNFAKVGMKLSEIQDVYDTID